jgi:molybdopterin-guanine dinucleotide biosynthesis protein A
MLVMGAGIVSAAGFVLVGGRSSRMGRDKALLPYRGTALATHIADAVAAAAGSATLVGDPDRYSTLGYPVIPDRRPGLGPLGGIEASLAANLAEWNLILACDMPEVEADFLASLIAAAAENRADCVIPDTGRPQPLCAVYHARCREAVTAALDAGIRRVHDALRGLRIVQYPVAHHRRFQNVNTPHEWTPYQNG